MLSVKIQPLPGYHPIPRYQTDGAAGADLCAAIEAPMTLFPGERALIPCGFLMELPEGYEAQVRPRSGLALKHGITVLNSPGTIDSDYRGQVGVILINHGTKPFEIQPDDRIAQMVIAVYTKACFPISFDLTESARGELGFGSSGVA